jgi:phenylalanyl-tRNA synthetase alpha chain
MHDQIKNIQEDLEQSLNQVQSNISRDTIHKFKIDFLGKKGKISALLKYMGNSTPEERPILGKAVNDLRNKAQAAFDNLEECLQEREILRSVSDSNVDPTLPGMQIEPGSIHPLNRVRAEIIDFFSRMGFSVVNGREIETDWYNFEALNIPAIHPARDMQDTFYIDKKVVLRTQTSNIQIHVMEESEPPLKILAPGHVYRADNDASHAPMFQQVEGLVVDEGISFAHLKGILYLWVQHIFGKDVKLRFRPSYFPFTEPSAEMDVSCSICCGKGCRVCSNTGWLELGGCGCVDPNVFEKVGYDSEKYTGFAFGFGIDRITMIKYGIPEIGLLTQNDNRFLKQF